jgi:dienelactone hydrolase
MAVALTLVAAVGCARRVAQKPPDVVWDDTTVDADGTWVNLTLAKPASSPTPPKFVVVFASGDGGLSGISQAVLEHLGEQGYWVVGFSSEEAFENVMSESGGRPNYSAARDAFAALIAEAKHALNVPDRTPVIVTGMSRGANVVIASAGDPILRPGIIGAVAVALTREFDNLIVRDQAKTLPFVRANDQGRLQTYPAIERLGSLPLAIIQSTNDDYVPSAESRRLLGPDTPTRRLFEVTSTNHEFDGGHDVLMRDLDDAIRWIATRS